MIESFHKKIFITYQKSGHRMDIENLSIKKEGLKPS